MDPIRSTPVTGPKLPPVTGVGPATSTGQGGTFADQLRAQIEQVSQLQGEAEQGVQNILTGRSDNLTEVLAATRKAEVAFSLLMEIRNKLVDSYNEMKQLRV